MLYNVGDADFTVNVDPRKFTSATYTYIDYGQDEEGREVSEAITLGEDVELTLPEKGADAEILVVGDNGTTISVERAPYTDAIVTLGGEQIRRFLGMEGEEPFETEASEFDFDVAFADPAMEAGKQLYVLRGVELDGEEWTYTSIEESDGHVEFGSDTTIAIAANGIVGDFDDHAMALAVVIQKTGGEIDKFTVSLYSQQGSTSGKVNVSVSVPDQPSPIIEGVDVWKYKIVSSEDDTTVAPGQNVQNWSVWDGWSPINDVDVGKYIVMTLAKVQEGYAAYMAGYAQVGEANPW